MPIVPSAKNHLALVTMEMTSALKEEKVVSEPIKPVTRASLQSGSISGNVLNTPTQTPTK